MPNALAEAMVLGVPCIATDCPVGSSRYLIDDGVNGLLVPIGDFEATITAMHMLLEDKEKAKRLASNARKIADDLTADRIYGDWEKSITNIASNH